MSEQDPNGGREQIQIEHAILRKYLFASKEGVPASPAAASV
jgi:hypothetical protein